MESDPRALSTPRDVGTSASIDADIDLEAGTVMKQAVEDPD
jgi:hypothetical protein